jgi:hypothetical protein
MEGCMTNENIRQGDILFTATPEAAQGKSQKQLTIAEGEFTGHHHVLIAEAGSEVIGNRTHFTVKGKAKLVHPEHGTLEFTSGNYVVSMEREYDYIDQTLKAVRD